MSTKKLSDKEFDAKLRALNNACGGFEYLGGLADAEYKAVPTGFDDLDCLLTKGANGIYLGGIIEIFGSESSGKSCLALRAVRNAQALGYQCCWIDAEAGFSPDFAKIHGVDCNKLVFPKLYKVSKKNAEDIQLLNAGEVLELAFQAIKSNAFALVVLDSVAGLSPERIVGEEFDPNSKGMGERARSMSDILPKIAHMCSQTQTSLILVNQLRDQPGAYYQNPYHTPGGRAMRHMSQQRISVEKIGGKEGKIIVTDPEGNDEVIGHWARVKIVKNKKAPPVPEGIPIHIPIYYREYDPDDAHKCYELARKLKIITINKGVLTWTYEDKNQREVLWKDEGESAIMNFIRENKYESKLSFQCVESAKGDKNQKLKNPVVVSKRIAELAKTYRPEDIIEIKKDDSKKKV